MVDPHGNSRGPSGPLQLEQALEAVQPALDGIWSRFARARGRGEGAPQRLLFTSPDHGAGTTTLAIATALGLTRNMRQDVCLVEANCFSPAMADYLRLPATPGMTDVLDGKADLEKAVRNSLVHGLYVLSAGSFRRPLPGELASPEVHDVLAEVARSGKHLVIDGPPLLDHPESRALFEFVDRAVLVLRARDTKQRRAEAAVRVLRESGVEIVGTVLNRFRSDLPFGLEKQPWA